MKDTVDVAVVQFTPQLLDAAANAEAMAQLVHQEAVRHPTDLIVFPELATTGYPPPSYSEEFHRGLAAQAEPGHGPTAAVLAAAARETGTYVTAGFAEKDERGNLYNSMLLVSPGGEILAVQRKLHLWQDEYRYFTAGDSCGVVTTDLGVLGLSICYDSKFPEVSRAQMLAGADILIALFAYSPDPGVPVDILAQRAVIRAWENTVYFIAANQLGDRFPGRSAVAGPTGQVLTDAESRRDTVVRARLTARALSEAREAEDIAGSRRSDLYADPVPPEPRSDSR